MGKKKPLLLLTQRSGKLGESFNPKKSSCPQITQINAD